ncbi:hypothetical protein [Prosthecomicrobium hirschii]|uniref:hypothetical protein n=1 Tax=Prosthecodimorpha hirschii TaxID=665126 RepID=UPI002220E775|nr:hypothetical protein [Prosthecomicrobium hirschii]MCW1841318.1 hypothetical protein [Prosthecomicrobium hirschii]
MKTKVWLILAVFIILTFSESKAQTSRTLDAFDHICVASRLDHKLGSELVDMFSKQYSIALRDPPDGMIRQINPNATQGWGLIDGRNMMVVLFGKTPDGTFLSNSCAITTRGMPFKEGKSLVEKAYQVQKIDEFRQGTSQLTVYHVNLVGFGRRKIAISVQGFPGDVATSIGLYELPPS